MHEWGELAWNLKFRIGRLPESVNMISNTWRVQARPTKLMKGRDTCSEANEERGGTGYLTCILFEVLYAQAVLEGKEIVRLGRCPSACYRMISVLPSLHRWEIVNQVSYMTVQGYLPVTIPPICL